MTTKAWAMGGSSVIVTCTMAWWPAGVSAFGGNFFATDFPAGRFFAGDFLAGTFWAAARFATAFFAAAAFFFTTGFFFIPQA